MGRVETVLGPVPSERLGRVLQHEHLLSLVPGPWLRGGERPGTGADQVEPALAALAPVRRLGFDTIVDLSPYGVVGRSDDGGNVTLLREISERSGLHVVAGVSVYLESFSPTWTHRLGREQLVDHFVRTATEGIGGTGIRAGIFGEQATSLGRITSHEEKCLRAAARAGRATGLAVSTHTTHGTMVREQIAILTEEGFDLRRAVIGHLDIPTAVDDILFALEAGARVAFDTVGKQHWDFFVAPASSDRPDGEYGKRAYFRSDAHRADRVAELVRAGYADRILLGMDLTGAEVYLNPATHGQAGYSYLARGFVPMLQDRGVSDGDIERMLRTNAVDVLTIQEDA